MVAEAFRCSSTLACSTILRVMPPSSSALSTRQRLRLFAGLAFCIVDALSLAVAAGVHARGAPRAHEPRCCRPQKGKTSRVAHRDVWHLDCSVAANGGIPTSLF